MQVVIIEQDPEITNDGGFLQRWNVQLLGSSKVIARIRETARQTFERYELVTYGNHPSGNRYRTYGSMEETTKVVMEWAKRRFRESDQ